MMRRTLFAALLLAVLLFAFSACAEETLFDDENLLISVKSVTVEGDSMQIKLYLENKTDKKLMFALETATVNGWVADPLWATDVPAGKKANSTMT